MNFLYSFQYNHSYLFQKITQNLYARTVTAKAENTGNTYENMFLKRFIKITRYCSGFVNYRNSFTALNSAISTLRQDIFVDRVHRSHEGSYPRDLLQGRLTETCYIVCADLLYFIKRTKCGMILLRECRGRSYSHS